MQRSEIEQAFLKAGLKARTPAIEQLTRNSIRLSTTPVDEQQLAVGVSKLGGHPDLPPGISWPLLQGKPQAFLMQICLADMQNFDVEKLLPPQGMLWFFYDATQETFGEQVQDRIGWRILFTPESAPKLQRLPTPKGLPSASLFPSHALIPHSELTLALQPDLELSSFDWSEQEQEAYEQVLDMLHPPAERAQPHHRLLGYPDTIQDDMRMQCQLVSHGITDGNDPRAAALEAGAADWILLLQIDSDASANMRWSSDGMLYYWIKRTDLQARLFDEGWLVLQAE